jgi:hypothetical protein
MNINEYVEITNFFEQPDLIREIGLRQNYNPCNFFNTDIIFSGFRSEIEISFIKNYIIKKIEKYTKLSIKNISFNFNLNTYVSYFGLPHTDSQSNTPNAENSFAGVIYLNPILPNFQEFGTTLYEDPATQISRKAEAVILYNVSIPADNPYKRKVAEIILQWKNSFNVKKKIKNEYNKMVLYPSLFWHAPDYYFGDNLENSRMTISIFGVFE